jgi:hypothetical protein
MRKGILIALILSIITPLILTYLFLEFMTDIDFYALITGMNFPQILAILSFSSLSFGYNIPLFGFCYLIPFFIWLMTGVFVGLFTKSVKIGIILTLLGLCIQILLSVILTSVNPALIPASLITADNVGLLGGFSYNLLITLSLFLCWWALLLPGSVLGGIMGGLTSRSTLSE